VAGTFGVFAVAFLLRGFFYGYNWLAGVVDGDANFKVMTIWTLIYFAVCATIARVAFGMRVDEGAKEPSAPDGV
jgi:hypothetical protein